MTPAPGLSITPHLTLRRKLGEGGMGSVWAADHATLQTEVAVKIISAEHATDETARARFMREAATAAQIKSPHVVQMLDRGFLESGTPYLVMELLHGESLRERLERAGPMRPGELALALRQVAPALDLAHDQGIVHRDLKPENLFLTGSPDQPFVKILDFGIAKSQHDGIAVQTATFAVIGTPRYMSPEQLVDTKNTTKATDVWALGVVAYEALTGTVPFDGDSVPALTLAVFGGEFPKATQRNPSLPEALDAWFSRIFQQEPDDRFSSIGEMAKAYEEALRAPSIAHAPTLAQSAGSGAPVATAVPAVTATPTHQPSGAAPPPTSKRSRLGLWLGLVGALVMTAGVATGAVLWTRDAPRDDTTEDEDATSTQKRRKKPRRRKPRKKNEAPSARPPRTAAPAPTASTAAATLTMRQMVRDAVRRNGGHRVFSYIGIYMSGYAKIEMQDPKVKDRIQRHAYRNNTFERRGPLKMKDADRKDLPPRLFQLKDFRPDKLDDVAKDAVSRAKDPAAKVFGIYIKRMYNSYSQAQQKWVRQYTHVVISVSLSLPDRDMEIEYWGDGTFRCIPRDGDPDGDGCPEDP